MQSYPQANYAEGLFPAQDFARFWRAYPKKRNKQRAWKIWVATIDARPPIDTLLEKIRQAKRSLDWQREYGRYVPLPENWLRNHGWDDEYPPCEPTDSRKTEVWWTTREGVEAKGKQLGIAARPGESYRDYTRRVREMVG